MSRGQGQGQGQGQGLHNYPTLASAVMPSWGSWGESDGDGCQVRVRSVVLAAGVVLSMGVVLLA